MEQEGQVPFVEMFADAWLDCSIPEALVDVLDDESLQSLGRAARACHLCMGAQALPAEDKVFKGPQREDGLRREGTDHDRLQPGGGRRGDQGKAH